MKKAHPKPRRARSGSADAFAAKRAQLIDRLADLVLADGLDSLSLRPAAARLGTSDRMLLYYFETKADLITAVLARTSERLALRLEAAAPKAPLAPGEYLTWAWATFAGGDNAPFIRLWLEVSARGARGEAPYREIAHQTVVSWLAWIEPQLDVPSGAERRRSAAAILAVLEGLIVLEMASPGTTGRARELLIKSLEGRRA